MLIFHWDISYSFVYKFPPTKIIFYSKISHLSFSIFEQKIGSSHVNGVLNCPNSSAPRILPEYIVDTGDLFGLGYDMIIWQDLMKKLLKRWWKYSHHEMANLADIVKYHYYHLSRWILL